MSLIISLFASPISTHQLEVFVAGYTFFVFLGMKSPRVFAALVAFAFGRLLQLDVHGLAVAMQPSAVGVVAVRQHQRTLAHESLTTAVAFL